MHSMNRFTIICATLLVSLLVTSTANAQRARDAAEDEANQQQTRQAQAVSKDVYDEIQKAQELVEGEPPEYQQALRILDRLYDPDDLTEYEQANVLNYIGFVHYNMENVPEAIRTYQLMLNIPSLEPQMAKQTTYTLAQLNMMEENYSETLRLMNEWFVLETNPAPEPYILLAQVYYQLEQYANMVQPIEQAMQVAERRQTEVKEDWYVLLNFAYFQQEDYGMVRDIQKILLEGWPNKRYWLSLAGAFTELGEDENLISAYHAVYTQGLLEQESEFVTMAQLFMQAEVPYKAAVLLETAPWSATRAITGCCPRPGASARKTRAPSRRCVRRHACLTTASWTFGSVMPTSTWPSTTIASRQFAPASARAICAVRRMPIFRSACVFTTCVSTPKHARRSEKQDR